MIVIMQCDAVDKARTDSFSNFFQTDYAPPMEGSGGGEAFVGGLLRRSSVVSGSPARNASRRNCSQGLGFDLVLFDRSEDESLV